MLFCTKCLNMTTRPNIVFSADGLCPPCKAFIDPNEIDWDSRNRELREILEFAQNNRSSGYDCIIGVSGGKDSTRQAIFVRDVLKMNPLLVSLNYPPEQMSDLGARNLTNLINLGFSCVNISCSPNIWKVLMKEGFYRFGNWAKSTEMALFSSVPKLAVAYQIPLIWWGENISVALGDLNAVGQTASDGNRIKYSHTISGGDIEWMLEKGFKRNQLNQFLFPSDEEMRRANIRIVFLAHFIRDFSIFINGNISALRGLHVKNPSASDADFWGTSMLDEEFFTVNMMIKWLKFGFGRTNDNVNEEIRAGRMTREEAIQIVEKFDGKCSTEVIEKFCQYIEITIDEFWRVVDSFVNPMLFAKVDQGVYRKKFKVGINY